MNTKVPAEKMRTTPRPVRALFVAAGVMVLSFTGCVGPSDQDLVQSARSSLQKQDPKAAIVQLKSALQKTPQSGEVRFLLGQALLEGGDAKSAEVELRKALDLGYSQDFVLPLLAQAMLTNGQAKTVTELYARAQLADPAAWARLKSTVAAAYGALGQMALGAKLNDEALQLDPKNKNSRLLRARLAAGSGALDDALELVAALLAEDPKMGDAWYLKGEILWVGKRDSAASSAALQQALTVDPMYLPAHALLMRQALQKGNLAEFKQHALALQKVMPDHPETRLHVAEVALIDGDLKLAREIAQQLLRIAPDEIRVLQLAGTVEARAGAVSSAEVHLSKASRLAPDSPYPRRLLAEAYLRSSQPGKALATLQPALDQPDPGSDLLALAAEAFMQNGDASNAEAHFARAAKANPGDHRSQTALALMKIGRGKTADGFAQLESLAAGQSTTYADLALVVARMRRNEFDAALKAVDRLQGKLQEKPLPDYLKGSILLKRDDRAGARASFEKAVVKDPGYLPAVIALAAIDIAESDPDKARARLQAVLDREPKNARAMLALAELKQRHGDQASEVIALLTSAVSLEPVDPAMRLALVEFHLAQRNLAAAKTAAQEAVAVFPANAAVLNVLGRVQLATGELQQAVSTFRKVAAGDPASPTPHLRIAEAHAQSQDHASAVQSLRRALEISPNHLNAQQALIQVSMASKQPALAMEVARTVQTQRPTEPIGYIMEADVLWNQRKWEPAIAAMNMALQRGQPTEAATRMYGLYVAAGRTTDASKFAAAWAREHPRDGKFLSFLASMAMSRKDYGAAEAWFRSALAVNANDVVALNNLAWTLVQQGRPGATELARRANRLSPNQPSLMDTLALALAGENQFPAAIEWQKRTVAMAPANPLYQFNLAKLLLKAGDKAAARTELEKLALLGSRFDKQAEVLQLLESR